MAGDDLLDLEFLSIVAKISQEHVNYHLNFDDKILLVAEFLMALHDEFNEGKLQDMDVCFSSSFVENTHRVILSMHLKYKKRTLKNQDLPEGPDNIYDGRDLDQRPILYKIYSGKVVGLWAWRYLWLQMVSMGEWKVSRHFHRLA
jgi:hypothetical protein